MPTNDPYTKDNDSRFTLRIPTVLLDEVRQIADSNKRSTGKQIEFIIEQWLAEHRPKE